MRSPNHCETGQPLRTKKVLVENRLSWHRGFIARYFPSGTSCYLSAFLAFPYSHLNSSPRRERRKLSTLRVQIRFGRDGASGLCGVCTSLAKTYTSVLAHVRTKLHNALLDLRFGGLLRGGEHSRYPQLGAYAITNSSYSVIRQLFRGRVAPSDVLVDVGCGKGRVINAWLANGFSNRMVGIELDADVAAKTRERLRRFPNVSILSGDIIANFPRDGTIFYLFNPFNAVVLSKFKDALKTSIASRPLGQAIVIYYNCLHLEVFAKDEAYEIESGRLQHPYAVIHFPGRRGQGPSA